MRRSDGRREVRRTALTLRRLLLGVATAIAIPVWFVGCVRLVFPRPWGVPSPTGPIDLRDVASLVLPLGDGRVVWIRDGNDIGELERACNASRRDFDDTSGMRAFKSFSFKTIYLLNSRDEVEQEFMWYYPDSIEVLRGAPSAVIQHRGETRMIAADGQLGEWLSEMIRWYPSQRLEHRDLRPGDTRKSVRLRVLRAGKRPSLIFWMYAPGMGGVPEGKPYYSAGILTPVVSAGTPDP